LPSANSDSVSAAEHRRFPAENRQSRIHLHFAEGKSSFSRSEIIIPPKADYHSREA